MQASNITEEDIRQMVAESAGRLRIGRDCAIAADVIIDLDDGAQLRIGDRVSIRRGTTLEVNRDAVMVIEDDVAVGEHCFLSAMFALVVERGVGIANMVDIHDANHRPRASHLVKDDELTPYGSGFEGAPILIEHGALVSSKASLVAGTRVGQNSVIAANAVVTGAVPPNVTAGGVPARILGRRDGVLQPSRRPLRLSVAFFGTSIMEHLEAYSDMLQRQWDLPNIGSQLTVEGWRPRGYAYRLEVYFRVRYPFVSWAVHNFGKGGATSRDVLGVIQTAVDDRQEFDLAFFGCGLNDVWRRFQGRNDEAVDNDEYGSNYRLALNTLKSCSRSVICIGETAVAPRFSDAINEDVLVVNSIAEETARGASVPFLPVQNTFVEIGNQLELIAGMGGSDGESLWSDGIHLSDLGDGVLAGVIKEFLSSSTVIEDLLRLPRKERRLDQQAYAGWSDPWLVGPRR